MHEQITEVTAGLMDPACVQDTFVEGIGAITKTAGGCVRFTLYQKRHIGNSIERLVVAHLVWPAEVLAIATQQTATFIRSGTFFAASEMSSGAQAH